MAGNPRISWDEHLMQFAFIAASRSKDSNTHVGAALVRDNFVLCTAYNGPPRGVVDNENRLQRPEKYDWVVHAEANLIAVAARNGIRTEGAAVYTTHLPCARSCSGLLVQAGIEHVIFAGQDYVGGNRDEVIVRAKFAEAGVALHKLGER